ncbi:MAG: transcription termination/antitermination protein NusA [Deltaproteobacteria bacterium]|nr:transcription termination/antitermination protein NusA [Deltaproteobacteria bacterium]MBN2671396.1 transcription termination/antitermination protein NusA [Deltaproteobacteria bacterium]
MQDGALPLNMILDQVGRDKGINKEVLVEAIEAAILTAAKRSFGTNRDLEARFNDETGVVDLYQYMTVVDVVENPDREVAQDAAKKAGLQSEVGEELGFQIFYREEDEKAAKKQDKEFGSLLDLKSVGKGFGRIAAQTAKQVIIQRVRDAERENIFNEYKDRKGEVIAGIVRRFERNNSIIVDLGRTEAVIPAKEQTPRESYRPGDRVLAYVANIDKETKGPQIQLSRTDVGLLKKLFEMEVPEIYEGIVKIISAAREPGSRSKIAVTSRDADVDPVGACVGMRGARVQSVVQELRGEKIDIVPWDADPARFVCNAIQPAEVSRVIIDEANGSMELVVPDDKLSLAIGRRGQNVRLASQITNWKLDVVSETDFEAREKEAIASLAMVDGISDDAAMTMYKLGFRTVEEVAEADSAELLAIPGMGDEERITLLQKSARETMEVQRMQRIRQLISRGTPLTERERMFFISGIGERTIELLLEAGYRKVEDLAGESDMDRLALSTGLGLQKAQVITDRAQEFLDSEREIMSRIREEAEIIAAAEREEAEEAEAEETAEEVDAASDTESAPEEKQDAEE